MQKSLLCICILLIQATVSKGQHINYQNAKPVSPEIASFAKNIDIPMSYSSGLPTISIPLYTLKSGSLQVPVTLNYNASGIRVEEGATWVGLGWNLNTGGTLTRVVRDKPDDAGDGFMNMPYNRTMTYIDSMGLPFSVVPILDSIWFGIAFNEYDQEHILDFMPDIFSFQVQGYSGKFYYNQDSGRFVLTPYQNIKIESDSKYNILQFILTLPNGVKSYFGGSTNTTEVFMASHSQSIVNGVSNSGVDDVGSSYVSSWQLVKILSPSGQSIDYTYAPSLLEIREYSRGGETNETQVVTDASPVTVNTAMLHRTTFGKPVLRTISSKEGKVYFNSAPVRRKDVVDSISSMDTLVVKDSTGNIIKSFDFHYGYSESSDSLLLWDLAAFEHAARIRLNLQSITEKNRDRSDSLPPYSFQYNSTPLPNRLSASQDYWGYYNGKSNGEFLMPRIPIRPDGGLSEGYATFLGLGEPADRRIDEAYSQAGMLTSISYPTGGITSFTFEQNAVANKFFDPNAAIVQPDMIDKLFTFMPLLSVSAPYARHYSDTFRVIRPATKIKIIPDLPSPCGIYEDASCIFTIKITNLTDTIVQYTYKTTGTFYAFLPEALYRVEAFLTGSTSDPVPTFSVGMTWGERPDSFNFKFGGVRLKKAVSYSGNTPISRSFAYNIPGTETSSALICGFPVHMLEVSDFLYGGYFKYKYMSNSIIPLTTDGQTLQYKNVTEYLDSSQSSFKTQYDYLGDTLIDFVFTHHEGAPLMTREWRNNLLLGKTVFEKNGSDYRPLLKETHDYASLFATTTQLSGLITGPAYRDMFAYGEYITEHKYFPLHIVSERFLPVTSTTISYAYSSTTVDSLVSSSSISYNNDFLTSLSRTTNSKSQTVDHRTWYTHDFNDVDTFNIASLSTDHIMDIPIREETAINGKLVSGTIGKYNTNGLLSTLYAYESSSLLDTSSHDPNHILADYYQPKAMLYYDASANMKQVTPKDNNPKAYLWDYFSTYPVAETVNADYASISYTSFEADGTGNWDYSGAGIVTSEGVTGKNAFNLASSYNIERTGLDSLVSYTITYWLKDASGTCSIGGTALINKNGWTLYRRDTTHIRSFTISGSGKIDELRLHPKKAMMTTYTYDPLIGMTSQCDANNRIMYYEYDSFNRLLRIRDHDKNILKSYEYKYQETQ